MVSKEQSKINEQIARKRIGEKYCEWLDANGLYWCEQLPYSAMPGWTVGLNFSTIYEEDETESLISCKNRYHYFMSMANSKNRLRVCI